MGYNLYITRRKDWGDDSGPTISVEEWRKCVEADPELRMDESLGKHFAVWSGPSKDEIPWLAWGDGNIETKNPDEALIRKMASIAARLGAKVQGEEGETYDQAGAVHPAPPPGLMDRLKGLWSRITTAPITPMDASQLPFKVGDRVRDILGDNMVTVTEIDLKAEHGMGRITVKYDDGRVRHYAAFAHGLELAPKE